MYWAVFGQYWAVLRMYWYCFATVRIGLYGPELNCIKTVLAYIYVKHRDCIAVAVGVLGIFQYGGRFRYV